MKLNIIPNNLRVAPSPTHSVDTAQLHLDTFTTISSTALKLDTLQTDLLVLRPVNDPVILQFPELEHFTTAIVLYFHCVSGDILQVLILRKYVTSQVSKHTTMMICFLPWLTLITATLHTLCDFHNLMNCYNEQAPGCSANSLMACSNDCLSCFVVIGMPLSLQQRLCYLFSSFFPFWNSPSSLLWALSF